MKKYILPGVVLITGIAVSINAAIISVSGLSQMFAGNAKQVLIIIGVLEWAKVVIAGVLKFEWDKPYMKSWLRPVGVLATIVLMIITSWGIYGFFAESYEKTSAKSKIEEKQIEIIQTKKDLYQNLLNEKTDEKAKVAENINNLVKALQGNVVEYIDPETGQKIRSTSSSARRTFERQLNTANDQKSNLDTEIASLNDSLITLDIKILEQKANSEASAELGPLRYIQKVTGVSMDQVVNILTLMIMAVFDPLAIYLVILGINVLPRNISAIKNIEEKTSPEEISEDSIEEEPEEPNSAVENPVKSSPEIIKDPDDIYDERELLLESDETKPIEIIEEEEEQTEIDPEYIESLKDVYDDMFDKPDVIIVKNPDTPDVTEPSIVETSKEMEDEIFNPIIIEQIEEEEKEPEKEDLIVDPSKYFPSTDEKNEKEDKADIEDLKRFYYGNDVSSSQRRNMSDWQIRNLKLPNSD